MQFWALVKNCWHVLTYLSYVYVSGSLCPQSGVHFICYCCISKHKLLVNPQLSVVLMCKRSQAYVFDSKLLNRYYSTSCYVSDFPLQLVLVETVL